MRMSASSTRSRQVAAVCAGAAGAAALCACMYFYWRRRRRRRADEATRLQEFAALAASAKSAPVVASDEEFGREWPEFERRLRRYGVCGLDCEWHWRNDLGEEGPLALMQLATPDGRALLIRVQKLREIPEELTAFLEDPQLLKFGVGIDGDVRKIGSGLGVNTRGVVDLRHLVAAFGLRVRRQGLKSLSAELLGVDYSHLREEARSNWEAARLSGRQVEYAALDAVAGALLALRLCAGEKSPTVAETLRLWDADELRRRCRQFVDAGSPADAADAVAESPSASTGNDRRRRAPAARRNPLYHNCQMLAPDNQLMCTLDQRKAEWYAARNLAEVVSEQPYTIRLKFEPSGRPGEDQAYYLSEKVNRCVVCGRDSELQRRKVVPDEYRKNFPEFLKSHKSHDVVLLCAGCHLRSCQQADRLKQQLAQKYDAATSQPASLSSDSRAVRQAKSNAKALLMQAGGKANIPEQRLQELRAAVQEFLGVDSLSERELRQVLDMSDGASWKEAAEKHGAKVVRAVLNEGRILEFEKLWRDHFLQTMDPQYLPEFWSAEHRHASLRSAVNDFLSERAASDTA